MMLRNSGKMPENDPLGLENGWSLVTITKTYIGVIGAKPSMLWLEKNVRMNNLRDQNCFKNGSK